MSVKIGSHVVDRAQPPLSVEENDLVQRFHDLYYRRWLRGGADTINLSWFGYELLKCPLDLWEYQELLVRTRPDIVIETGTFAGGSALYFAMILDAIGHGRVVTIDVETRRDRPAHPRITYVTGSSVAEPTLVTVRQMTGRDRAMVVLDSDHGAEHVYQEIVGYSPFVQAGDYLIIEDTNVNGHPAWPDFGPGPMEAVNRFLSENSDFEIDERCERFLLTLSPRGFLRRKTGQKQRTT